MKSRIAKLLRIREPKIEPRGLLFGSGTTVPVDTTDGWQTGAIFQQTDGGASTSLYVNEGSVTSSDFNAVGSLAVADYSAGGTTAITISGAYTVSAITIVAGAISGQAFLIGTGISTPAIFGGNELVEWHGRCNSATQSNPLLRCRCSAPASTAMTTGGVIAGQFQAYGTDTNDVAMLNAIQGHCGIKGNCTLISGAGTLPDMVGGWFKIEDLGFDLTMTGSAAALVLGTQWNAGTTLTGNCDWMFLMKEGGLTGGGGVPDAIIRGYDGTGGGLANFLLDIPASLPYSAGDSSGTQSGKIAVNIGGSTKYIQTYSD